MYELDMIVTDLDCNDNGVLDTDDLSGGTSDDCNTNGVPDECDRDCNANGTPDECDIAGGTLTDANSNGFADECEVLHVDLGAAGSESGLGWTDAMTDLGAATAVAADPSNGFTEIWVATGTHLPDSGSGDRKATFVLAPGVSMYGGFTGSEIARDERDPLANPTILSGDLNGDDDGGGDNSENSLHVVSAIDTTAGTVFDGFVVTGGNADATGETNGGGMVISGGVGPIVLDCVFVGNIADNLGGGIHSNNNTAHIEGCAFLDNRANNRGGGLNNAGTGLGTIVNCLFSGNSANNGGGITNTGKPDVINCSFSRNSADTNGGGIYNLGGGSILTLSNCVLWNNDDAGGTDESAQVRISNGTAIVDYNCIQGWTGGLGGTGNIGDDPLFVDDDGDDNTVGTTDDNVRLGAASPCIDAADNTAVPVGVLTDRDGNPRFADDPDTTDSGNGTAPIVDMGAYELPVEGCPNACGDISASGGSIDLVDFASFALCFGASPDSSPACLCSDLDESGTINLVDFATFSLLFGSTPSAMIPDCTP
jgi:predicted outer membrane repeat protein